MIPSARLTKHCSSDFIDHSFEDQGSSRRYILRAAAAAAAVFATPPMIHTQRAFSSIASAAETKLDQGLISTRQVAELLHSVPTFTIVDSEGVPYMVVGEDAKVTGYFFTDFDEAQRVLKLAQASADKSIRESKKDPKQSPYSSDLVNPWNDAKISTVPLDVAASLVTRASALNAQGKGPRNYFQIAPSVSDIQDALAITGKDDLAEGKVPLFYIEDFMINDNTQSPLYFNQEQLKRAYLHAVPMSSDSDVLKKIRVSELFAILAELVKPGGTDQELKTVSFVAPVNSMKKAAECERSAKRRGKPPFVVGQRNVVL
jgi:Tic22-like family